MENTNEIMVNEEVMTEMVETVSVKPGKGLKIAAGVGVAAGLGALAYKFVVKPVVAKIKAKKGQQDEEPEVEAEYTEVEISEEN